MTFRDLAEQASQSAVGWAVAALLAGALWLIRRAFTNQKQIELMQHDQKRRDEIRNRDREEYQTDISEIKAGLHEQAQDIKHLLREMK